MYLIAGTFVVVHAPEDVAEMLVSARQARVSKRGLCQMWCTDGSQSQRLVEKSISYVAGV